MNKFFKVIAQVSQKHRYFRGSLKQKLDGEKAKWKFTLVTNFFALVMLGYVGQAYGVCRFNFHHPFNGETINGENPATAIHARLTPESRSNGLFRAFLFVNGVEVDRSNVTPDSWSSLYNLASALDNGVFVAPLQPGLNQISLVGESTDPSCNIHETMTLLYDPELVLHKNVGDPGDDLSCDEPTSSQGNPINIAIGNKFQKEEDFRAEGAFPLVFARVYNSFSGYWQHNYSAKLNVYSNRVDLFLPDGSKKLFPVISGELTPDADELGVLVQDGEYWIYTSRDGEVFKFDSRSRLIQLSNSHGLSHQLSYSGLTVTVTDQSGGSISFTEDRNNQPLTLNAPGLKVDYSYDSNERLAKVSKVMLGVSTERLYHYEDSRFLRFLTGITDERGVRYATWRYDDKGRAISSEHAGGQDKVLVDYNADGSSTVTNPLGKRATYRFQTILGVKRVTAIEGEPSANCPNSNSTFTYNTRGLLETRTDNKGYVTTYEYNARGLEESRTEAFGTPEARTVTIEWHPTLFLPQVVTEPRRVITYRYDDQGRQLSQTITER